MISGWIGCLETKQLNYFQFCCLFFIRSKYIQLLSTCSFHSSIHSLIQQLFIDCLLCAPCTLCQALGEHRKNKVTANMVLTWLLYVVIIHFLLTRKRSDSESATPSCETWGLDCELLGRSKYVFIFSILSSCRAPANRRVTNTACFSGMEMEVMEYMRTKEDLKGNSQ